MLIDGVMPGTRGRPIDPESFFSLLKLHQMDHLDQIQASTSKAIGSLAKKQADITRQGTQKLKFAPTLPTRRKKEYISLLL